MIEIKVPRIGVNDEYAAIARWHVANNSGVKKGDVVCTLETSKAVFDLDASDNGFVEYNAREGESVKVGDILFMIKDRKADAADFNSSRKNKAGGRAANATNKAVELARQHNINIDDMYKEGIIKESDVKNYIDNMKKNPSGQGAIETHFSKNNSGKLDKDFLKKIEKDRDFKNLSGPEKIDLYRKHGAQIGAEVTLGDGAVVLAEHITIGEKASIGARSFIRAEYFTMGKMAVIGNDVNIITRHIEIGELFFSGNRILIGGGGAFGEHSGLKTGIGCLISSECIINTSCEVILGNYVGLSPRVQIYTHNHWQNVLEGHRASFGPVIIGDNSYITGNVLIAPNVKVGKNVTILANSLVAERLDDYAIAVGVPAKVIGKTSRELSDEQKDRIMETVIQDIREILSYKRLDSKNVIYNFNCDLDKISAKVVLGFEFKGKRKESQIVFDLKKYEICGKEDRYSDEIRNVLRKRGIRFSPIYWRYSADEGFYNQ